DHGGAAVAQADQALELILVLGQVHGFILDAQDVHVALGEFALRAVGLRIDGDGHGGSFVVVELVGWGWIADSETGFRNPRRRLRSRRRASSRRLCTGRCPLPDWMPGP